MNLRASALRVLLVAVLILILHLGVAPHMRFAGVAAELPMGLAIAAGLAGGVERGAMFGLIFGFVVDLFLFTPVGMSALLFGIVGWMAGHLFMDQLEESPMLSSIAIGLGTAACLAAFVGLGLVFGESSLTEAPVGRIIVLASMMNAVLAFALMTLAHWMWAADPLRTQRFGS